MYNLETYPEQVEGDIEHYYGRSAISRPTRDDREEWRRSMKIVSMMTPLELELLDKYVEDRRDGKDVYAQVRQLSAQVIEREGLEP